MAVGDRAGAAIWQWLALFIALIAAESGLWRLGGWLGCHTVVATGVDIRLDLFRHLAGHPMRYFSEHLTGALGNRVTATAGSAGAIYGALTWRILHGSRDLAPSIVECSPTAALEDGPPDVLRAQGGAFAAMWASQAQGFETA